MSSSEVRYHKVQIILHWLIAAIIFYMIGLGLWMVELPMQHELPEGEESVRAFWFLQHKSLGLTVALLIAFRIYWRLTHRPPPLPDSIPDWQQRISSGVHFLLYAVMIAMPISGYLQSMYSRFDTYFWGITLPRLAEADEVTREIFTDIHQALAYAFIALLILHVGAAIKHRISGKEITSRMSLWH